MTTGSLLKQAEDKCVTGDNLLKIYYLVFFLLTSCLDSNAECKVYLKDVCGRLFFKDFGFFLTSNVLKYIFLENGCSIFSQ